MYKLLISFCFIASIGGNVIRSPGSDTEGFIVGGEDTAITDVPYQAAMFLNGFFSCGGSIVTSSHIVTAAHCVTNVSPKEIEFRVGSNKLRNGGKTVRAVGVFVHPKYDPAATDYDVAVVKLAQTLKFNEYVKPILLGTKEPEHGATGKTSGWGRLEENGILPPILQSVEVPVVGRKKCTELVNGLFTLTGRMICAGEEGKDACTGDSGGPLAVDGKLVGIVSFGKGCARKDAPGIYTNVANSEITSFIKEHTKLAL